MFDKFVDWVSFKFFVLYNYGIYLHEKYGILAVLAVIGLFVVGDIASLMIALKVLGIVSLFVIVCSAVLDDRKGKGLFPHYDEQELMEKAQQSALASAIVVGIKNGLMVIILILAVMFVRP